MFSKALTLERRPEVLNVFELFRQQEKSRFPVKVNVLPQRRFSPPRIQDIELKDGRSVLFNGSKKPVPIGTKAKITGKALKVVAGCYLGSVIAVKKGNDVWLRIKDSDVIDMPKDSKAEVKVLPSFKTE